MSEPVTHPPDAPSIKAGHELHDVRPRSMLAFAAALTALVVLSCLFLIWLLNTFERLAERHDPVLSPLAGNQVPPGPQLEVEPKRNLEELRVDEDRLLHHYRWIDKEQGVVQIPVERAMQLIAEEGLPAPKTSPPDAEDAR